MTQTKDTAEMVVFLMPDGSKVSNDPRFDIEQAREDMLASRENTGDVGIPRKELEAQTQAFHKAPLQGNEGPSNPQELLPTLGSGAQVQREDVKEQRETGATPPTQEVPDSNAAVQQVRDDTAKEQEALRKAMDALGDEGVGDPDKPYLEWKGSQLKAEALRRNAEREPGQELDLSGVKKKSDLVKVLEADDANRSGTAGA